MRFVTHSLVLAHVSLMLLDKTVHHACPTSGVWQWVQVVQNATAMLLDLSICNAMRTLVSVFASQEWLVISVMNALSSIMASQRMGAG